MNTILNVVNIDGGLKEGVGRDVLTMVSLFGNFIEHFLF